MGLSDHDKPSALWQRLWSIIGEDLTSPASACAVEVSAILVRHSPMHKVRLDIVDDWTRLLVRCSDPTRVDKLRISCAHALQVAAPSLLGYTHSTVQSENGWEELALRYVMHFELIINEVSRAYV